MLKTILIDSETSFANQLAVGLQNQFPEVKICAQFCNLETANPSIRKFHPNLIFLDANLPDLRKKDFYYRGRTEGFEIIITSNNSNHAMEAIDYQLCGYLRKPFCKDRLSKVVQNALIRLKNKAQRAELEKLIKELRYSNSNNKLVGIPTIEGFEFLKVSDIIRCEGLQKCTRIVTIDRSDIISSYNIGEFRKILENYQF